MARMIIRSLARAALVLGALVAIAGYLELRMF